MSDKFTENKISNTADLIGAELKNQRIEQELELETVAFKTKINIKYLKAIESGSFNLLPKGVYGKNFIQEYALFLGINPKKLIEVYESDYQEKDPEDIKNLFVKKISKTHHFLTIPRILKNSVILFVVFVCILYLGYYINNLLTPPDLVLFNLMEDITIEDHNFKIIGKTDLEAEVIINDEIALIDNNGNFEKEINLRSGLNIVSIESQKKYSKKKIIKRNIIVK